MNQYNFFKTLFFRDEIIKHNLVKEPSTQNDKAKINNPIPNSNALKNFQEFETVTVEGLYQRPETSLPIKLETKKPFISAYKFLYPKKELEEMQLQWIDDCLVLARGDTRSIEELALADGFQPQKNNSNNTSFKKDPYDVIGHRASSKGSALVSTTSSLKTAKKMVEVAQVIKKSEGKQNARAFIYLVKASGTIGPHPFLGSEEQEYSVPGGIVFNDIIAFRELTNGNFSDEDNIFISKAFIKEFPNYLNHIINFYLKPSEVCLYLKDIICETTQEEFDYINNKHF